MAAGGSFLGKMMHLDVVDLRRFYYRTALGRVAQRSLQGAIAGVWPAQPGETVVGFGFAAPLLRPYLARGRRVLSLMPRQQGVMPWPPGEANLSALVEETAWPLPAGSADRIILAHGLETCERPMALLQEVWRVLAPEGRVICVVPNRSGAWARRDTTPFGYGRPYSLSQLESVLDKAGFQPGAHASALFVPPSHRGFWLRSARLWERLGARIGARMFAGVLVLEAVKRVHARPPGGLQEAIKDPLRVLEGLTRPQPAPDASRRMKSGFSLPPATW